MATDRKDDLRAFRAFIDEQLGNGSAALTPAEALELWEIQNPSESEEHETVEAIRRGLADVEAGRVRPAREALAELRRKHNLPELP
jgi:predicted transcriptional regulator